MTVQKEVVEAVVQGNSTSAVRAAKGAGAAFGQMGGQAAAAGAKTRALGSAMSGVKASLIAGVAAGGLLVASLDKLADRAVEVTNVQSAMKFSVDAAADAVGHQTDKLTLAANANKLAAAGLVTTSAQYARLTGTVAKLADAQKIDLNTALEKTTKAILKGSDGALKQLGIYSDLEAEARRLGHPLSMLEKQQYVLNKLMGDGAELADAYGASVDKVGQKWVAFKNRLADVRDEALDLEGNLASLGKEIEDLGITIQMDLGLSTDEARKNLVRMGEAGDFWLQVMTRDFDEATLAAQRFASGTNVTANAVERVKAAQRELAQGKREEAEEQIRINRLTQEAVDQTKLASDLLVKAAKEKKQGRRGGKRSGEEDFLTSLLGADEVARQRDEAAFQQAGATDDIEDLLALQDPLQAAREQWHIQQLERQAREEEAFQRRSEQFELEIEALKSKEADEFEIAKHKIEFASMVAEHEDDLHAQRMLRIRRERVAVQEAEAAKQRAWTVSAKHVQGMTDVTLAVMGGAVQTASEFGNLQAKDRMRIEGLMTLAGAAREQFEAIRSFASYNYYEGALHEAAAVFGFVQGGLLVSGQVPNSAGGGGGGAVGGGGSFGFNPFAGQGTTRDEEEAPEADEVPVSPGQGKGQAKKKGASGGTTIETVYVLGATTDQVARALNRVTTDGGLIKGKTLD
jgi:hypothetical protein